MLWKPTDPDKELLPGVVKIRDHQAQMVEIRDKFRGEDSPEEEAIIEQMDDLWRSLTDAERRYLSTVPGPHHEALLRWFPPQVRWGWSIQCAHPHCTKTLMKWGKGTRNPIGPPPLNVDTGDWYFRSDSARDHFMYGYRMHRAYCPEHKLEAVRWEREVHLWNQKRNQVGQKTYIGLLDRLVDWGLTVLKLRVNQTMAEWVAENPKPKPPWSRR